jgi:nucleotide-binding universal stress UspA family protein
MPHISKILFPIDFSDSCLGATRYVEAFAWQFKAEIMLLHAVGMGEHRVPGIRRRVRNARLDSFLESELQPFTTHRVCVTGDPAPAIVDAAQAWRPDLIMMPTHGRGDFRRHLLGSVTAKVLHDLEFPVWTSVHAEAAPSLEEIHCRRILSAVDFTERSERVLEWAAWLAGEYQASLGIVHAMSEVDPWLSSGSNLGMEFRQYVFERARKEIEALQTDVGTAAQVFINPGKADAVVAGAAAEFKADLLVIGRRSGAGIAGDLLHSASAILREAPCPVVSI